MVRLPTKEETEERYEEARSELRLLTLYAHAVSAAIQGREAADDQQYYASIIFSKIVSHAITLIRSIPQSMAIMDSRGAELWDVSSACCLARAILEANDALAYMADKSGDPAQKMLRIRVWELHDKERRLAMLEAIGSSAPEVEDLRREAALLRREILDSAGAKTLHASVRGKISKGDSPDFLIPMRERCERVGINYKYHQGAKMFLSAYVHTHPIALHQLTSFRAGDADSLNLLSLPVRYSIAFLAKSLEIMQSIFGRATPPADEATTRVILIWASIVAEGVSAPIS